VTDAQVNFNAPASLRKWPSINKERRTDAAYPEPYLLFDGTLDECLREMISKPVSSLIRNTHRTSGAIGERRAICRARSRTRAAARVSISLTSSTSAVGRTTDLPPRSCQVRKAPFPEQCLTCLKSTKSGHTEVQLYEGPRVGMARRESLAGECFGFCLVVSALRYVSTRPHQIRS
jgi:hypothetical protein